MLVNTAEYYIDRNKDNRQVKMEKSERFCCYRKMKENHKTIQTREGYYSEFRDCKRRV